MIAIMQETEGEILVVKALRFCSARRNIASGHVGAPWYEPRVNGSGSTTAQPLSQITCFRHLI